MPVHRALLMLLRSFCIRTCCSPVTLGWPVCPWPMSWHVPTPQGTLAPLLRCYKASSKRSSTENNQTSLSFFFLIFLNKFSFLLDLLLGLVPQWHCSALNQSFWHHQGNPSNQPGICFRIIQNALCSAYLSVVHKRKLDN